MELSNDSSLILEQLTTAEKFVYEVLIARKGRPVDVGQIAKQCKLSDLQVIVALQLLMHKKMLPTEKILF